MFELYKNLTLFIVAPVSAQANSRSEVKRSGRSQNRTDKVFQI